MNIFCPSCGSRNDGFGKFCWKCGTSLANVPRAGEPGAQAQGAPATQPATAQPPAMQPPTAQPTVAAPPPSLAPSPPTSVAGPPPAAPGARKARMSMPLLIGSFVAVLGIGAAVGIVLGTSGDTDPSPSPQDLPTAAPSLAVPTPGPIASGPIASIGPGPTSQPGPTPTPFVATPAPVSTPAPTTGAGAGKDVSNQYLSITAPADWESAVYETSLTVSPAIGGNLYLESGYLKNPETTAVFMAAEIAWYKDNYPDTKICRDEKDSTLPNGPTGRSVILCFTAKTQTGNTYPASVYIAEAMVTKGQDTILFYLSIYGPDTEWNAIVEAVKPILPSIKWKLHEGG